MDENQLSSDISNLYLTGCCQEGFVGFNSTELIRHNSQQSVDVHFFGLRFLWNVLIVGDSPILWGFQLQYDWVLVKNHFRAGKCRGADPKRQGELARENSADL